MSQLRKDPVREVPKRVLLISLVITVLIIGLSLLFDWPTLLTVVGFWMGVAINLVNFRIIVLGSKSFLEKSEAGKRASMTPNIMLRYFLYGAVFLIAWRIGTSTLLASFLGACMVNFAFKSDGFFTMGLEKEGLDLKERASIDRAPASETEEGDHREEVDNKQGEALEEEIEVEKLEKEIEEELDKVLEEESEEELDKVLEEESEEDLDKMLEKELKEIEEIEEIEVYL